MRSDTQGRIHARNLLANWIGRRACDPTSIYVLPNGPQPVEVHTGIPFGERRTTNIIHTQSDWYTYAKPETWVGNDQVRIRVRPAIGMPQRPKQGSRV